MTFSCEIENYVPVRSCSWSSWSSAWPPPRSTAPGSVRSWGRSTAGSPGSIGEKNGDFPNKKGNKKCINTGWATMKLSLCFRSPAILSVKSWKAKKWEILLWLYYSPEILLGRMQEEEDARMQSFSVTSESTWDQTFLFKSTSSYTHSWKKPPWKYKTLPSEKRNFPEKYFNGCFAWPNALSEFKGHASSKSKRKRGEDTKTFISTIKLARLDVLGAPDRLLHAVRARDEPPLRLRRQAPPQRPLPLQLPDVVPDPDCGLGGGAGHHVEKDDLKEID